MTGEKRTGIRTVQSKELRLQVAIKSVQDEVTNVVGYISEWLLSHCVAPEPICELELVIAEALNNVVEHAYLYSEEGEIDILVRLRQDQLQVTITDRGCKFDGPPPLKEMDVENMDFEELPEGGFGWNLIQTLTDSVEFEHKDKQNRLTLTRNLATDTAA
jgi:serine/threonine-protein kinase RsbW